MFIYVLSEAFQRAAAEAGASEHDGIQICWATGEAVETVMIFKEHVKVTMLDTIYLPGSWRRVEGALIEGATEHNEELSMLIYNTHQPSSKTHPFTPPAKIACCRYVLRHAIREHSVRPNNMGFSLWRRR